jgi:tRNA A37 N6-isopentenylltransferase MiaA
MTAMEAIEAFIKRGVEFRLTGGSMQYCDVNEVLTPKQHEFLHKNRPALAEAYRRWERDHGERIEDHQPETAIRGCWGLLKKCKKFSDGEMDKHSCSVFATVARKNGGCGDCTIFHAQRNLEKRQREWEKEERKKAWLEKNADKRIDAEFGKWVTEEAGDTPDE